MKTRARTHTKLSYAQGLLGILVLLLAAIVPRPALAAAPCTAGANSATCDIDNNQILTLENTSGSVANGYLYIGHHGTGTLMIGQHGSYDVGGHIQVGNLQNSLGTIRVAGQGATLKSRLDLNLGVHGTGSLEIKDGGHVITGGDAKIGNLDAAQGTATVSGNGSRWIINSYLVVGNSSATTGTLTINEGGVVSTGNDPNQPNIVYVARYTGTTGTINIGSAAGTSASAGGTLDAAQLFFGAGDGTLVFNHTASAGSPLVFTPEISGSGTILHESGFTRLTGANTYLGTTTVNDGTLFLDDPNDTVILMGTVHVLNNGILDSNKINVAQGGRLAGNGTVRSNTVTIKSGGTIAPGSSIDTLRINGNLTLESGARYLVEVDPNSSISDQIHVTGTATIAGGSVVHIGTNSHYQPLSSYRILTAGTGLTGAFNSVASNFAFLTPELAYDYSDYTVDLILKRNATAFTWLAHTPNQIATAQALESLPAGNPLLQRILTLANGAPASTYNSLSGEIHATTASALYLSSHTARQLPLKHLRTNLHAGRTWGAPLAQVGSALPPAALPQSAALPLWADVLGSWQHISGDGNTAALKQSTSGLLIGGDHALTQGWRLGAALGYADSRIRAHDRDSRAEIETYSATLYGGKAFALGSGKLNVLAGGAYSRHTIKTTRHTTLADWHHTLKANYRASSTQIFGEIGYALTLGNTTLEPYAGLAWTQLSNRAFIESGGPTALSGHSQRNRYTTSTLGLRASTDIKLGNTQAQIYGTAGWRHAFGHIAPQQTLAFQGSQPFTVAGTPIARNSAVLELGADINLSPKARLGLSYNGQLAKGSRDHAGKISMQWRF